MNTKMAINTDLSIIESKKNKIDTENILMLPDRMGVEGMGEKGKGIKEYKLVVTE